MIQLFVGISLAVMAVGFFLFAEFNLRTGEVLMWVGLVLFVIVIVSIVFKEEI